jgi:tetratricopeptide (TPR) repeat protein
MTDVEALPAEFLELSARALRAAEAGEFDEALRVFDEARAWAAARGETRLVDLVIARRASIPIEDGRGQGELPGLRDLLVRSLDPMVCRFAAYNLARWYELAREYKKALFYARLARERSELTHRPEWLAASHNQVGNILLAESKVEEACAEYEAALGLMPAENTPSRARVLDNLGYCRVLQARLGEGLTLLHESLRLLRLARAERYEISTRIDLCFAHLEAGRYGVARRQGERALDLARAHGDSDSVKNAYYLLGETANLAGNAFAARRYFLKLQQEFFPDQHYLPGFLLAVDVRKLVNLHA